MTNALITIPLICDLQNVYQIVSVNVEVSTSKELGHSRNGHEKSFMPHNCKPYYQQLGNWWTCSATTENT